MADTPTAPLPDPAGQRRWRLTAAIAAITVFGLNIGQGVPLLSLLLEAHGTDPTINGLNAAATFAGVLVGPLLVPHCIRRLGVRNFLLLCFAMEVAITPLLKLFESPGAWFVLRAAGGICGSCIFTASEAWINLLAGDTERGRVIAIYGAALSAGIGTGPLLLSFTGIAGWPPFIVNAGIIATGALPLLAVGNGRDEFGRERASHPLIMFTRAPLILFSVALFGLYEATMLALLPIWGVRTGMPPRLAAATLSAVYLGSVVLQLPIGWLSDRAGRLNTLRACGGVCLAGSVAIIIPGLPPMLLFAVIAVWGGVATAIYAVALSMAGDRFRGEELVSVNAALIIAYGIGALIGPGLGGAAMHLHDAQGLFWFFILLFAGFLGTAFVGGRRG